MKDETRFVDKNIKDRHVGDRHVEDRHVEDWNCEDEELSDFLRANAPDVPRAGRNLEDKIMRLTVQNSWRTKFRSIILGGKAQLWFGGEGFHLGVWGAVFVSVVVMAALVFAFAGNKYGEVRYGDVSEVAPGQVAKIADVSGNIVVEEEIDEFMTETMHGIEQKYVVAVNDVFDDFL